MRLPSRSGLGVLIAVGLAAASTGIAGRALQRRSERLDPPFPPTGVFADPEGLAIDAHDQLYVADEDAGALIVCGLDGAERARLTRFPGTEFPPTLGGGVAVVGSGHVLLVTPWGEVAEVQLDGPSSAKVLRRLGSLDGTEGVALGPDGRLYVAEEDVRKIRVYADGAQVAAWCVRDDPEDLLVARSSLYVVYAKARRVARHDLSTGELLEYVGQDADFAHPEAIALGPDGNLYVTDQGSHRIVVLDPAGERVLRVIGGPGRAPGRFQDPEDVVFTRDGRMVVADGNNGRLQVLTLEGRVLAVID